MLKKVRLDKSAIGNYYCVTFPVDAKSKEQALKRYIRYAKISKDIKYLGDIVIIPTGSTHRNIIEYREHLYELFKITRPYQTEFEIFITELYTFSKDGFEYEKLKKCPYKIISPFHNALGKPEELNFPTIEMARDALTKLEHRVKKSSLKDKTIHHNIPI